MSTAPTPAQLEAARNGTLPDVAAPGLRVLLCGINPSLWSAAVQHHFARPGNRFWPALHDAGITPRLLPPDEQHELLAVGVGITNVVPRATARADELTRAELEEGGRALTEKVARLHPGWLVVLGVTAYRSAFGRRGAKVGEQPDHRVAGARVWVLPNPSGLNAHYQRADLARAFREMWQRTTLD